MTIRFNFQKENRFRNKNYHHNFEFMTQIHKEIMERYQPDGIFSNRWAGHGICYCEHCKSNFRKYSGLDLPGSSDRFDPIYQKYSEWSTDRLKDLWILWDGVIRKQRISSRFIPNGFPDKVITGQLSDIVFTDHQARSGVTMPWSNGKVAKELRASIGMKPLGGIFSVGFEEQYRWKDSVQSEAEIRVWVAEGGRGHFGWPQWSDEIVVSDFYQPATVLFY